MSKRKGVLRLDKGYDSDYTFHKKQPETGDTVSVEFGKFAVHIHRTDGGIVVDVWEAGGEMDYPIDSLSVFDVALDKE